MSINLVALTGAALVNGLNPCGIGMMITFLGYLLVFGNSKNSKTQKIKNSKYGISLDSGILKDGLIYLASVFVTYLFLGLFFYGLAFYLQRLWLASVFKYVMAGILTIAGLIQFKDVFWENFPITFSESMLAAAVEIAHPTPRHLISSTITSSF